MFRAISMEADRRRCPWSLEGGLKGADTLPVSKRVVVEGQAGRQDDMLHWLSLKSWWMDVVVIVSN